MESTMSAGAPSPPSELNALLERLLNEAEAGSGNTSPTAPPPAPDPPPAPSSASAQMPEASPTGTSRTASVPTASVSTASVPTGVSPSGAFPLGALLANPALLTALPTLAENLGPLLGGGAGGVGSSPKAIRPHTIDRHTALLCAVKPYLSPQRQSAAETVIRLCRIWDALERSGISLTGLLGGLGAPPPTGSAGNDGEVT